jgi:hypothetical protein
MFANVPEFVLCRSKSRKMCSFFVVLPEKELEFWLIWNFPTNVRIFLSSVATLALNLCSVDQNYGKSACFLWYYLRTDNKSGQFALQIPSHEWNLE